MVAYFFVKTGYVATVPLELRRMVNSKWYTIISFEIFEKRTRDESLFTIAKQVLAHRLKSAPF